MSFTGIRNTKLEGEEARKEKPDSSALEHKCWLTVTEVLVMCRKYLMTV